MTIKGTKYKRYTEVQLLEAIKMKSEGISCCEISRRLGVNRSLVSLWVRGKCRPSVMSEFAAKAGHEEMSEAKAYILGVMCGDGSIWKNKNGGDSVGLDVKDEDFAEAFARAICDVYGFDAKVTKQIHANLMQGFVYRVRLGIKSVCDDLMRLSPAGYGTVGWRVPKCVASARSEERGAFLRGFFDSEGYAGKQTQACSTNEAGLLEVASLLATLGIRTTYASQATVGKSVLHKILISASSRRLFLEKVGFSIKRKQEALRAIVEAGE